MNLMLRRHWLLAAVPLAVLAPLLLYELRLDHPHAPLRTAPTAMPAAALIVAAAPGWVDVQGGMRHLSVQADGVVTELAQAGDAPVAAGSVLLRLDDRDLKLEQQANALDIQRQQAAESGLIHQLQQSKEEVSRLQALVKIQAEPADVLRQSQAQLHSLDGALQAARLDVASSKIKQQSLALQATRLQLIAPSRGRVLRLDVHEGEAVSRSTPLIWFAPDAPLIVRAELDERLFTQVRVGMNAEVEAEGGNGRVFRARLLSIASQVGPVRALPEVRSAPADDRVVECVLELADAGLLIGQRVIVRIRGQR